MEQSLSNINFYSKGITLKEAIKVSFFAYIIYMVFYLTYNPSQYYPIIITLASFNLIHIFLLYLLMQGKYSLTKILFVTLSVFYLLLFTFKLMGSHTGVHYYLVMFSMLSFTLTNPNRVWTSFLYFGITFSSFVIAEFDIIKPHTVVEFPEDFAKFLHIQSVLISFFMVFYINYILYKVNVKKEELIITNNNQLISINNQLEESQTELQKANETKSKFLSIIAHDLKSPLSAIIGLSDVLNQDLDFYTTEELKVYIKAINDSGNRINMLLMNLLNWARSQNGSIKPSKNHFRIYNIVKNNCDLFAQNLKEKNIQIAIKDIDEKESIFADEDMIDTVIRNLISNAIKFTPNNGNINLMGENTQSGFQLHISDSGIGIDQKNIDRIFNKRNIISTHGTNKEQGMGLGLHICKDFLDLNDCSLNVNSEINKGSTFTIHFPNEEKAISA